MSDEDLSALIRSVQCGDDAAFERLVRMSEGYVFATVVRQLGREDAEAVAQEVFLAVFGGIGRLGSDAAYWAWLRTIVHRKCTDRLRSRYRSKEHAAISLNVAGQELCERWMTAAAVEEFRSAEERASAQEVLCWALAQLGPEDRMVVTLVALEEMSIADASLALGWTRTATKVRLFRARRRLRSIIEERPGC